MQKFNTSNPTSDLVILKSKDILFVISFLCFIIPVEYATIYRHSNNSTNIIRNRLFVHWALKIKVRYWRALPYESCRCTKI